MYFCKISNQLTCNVRPYDSQALQLPFLHCSSFTSLLPALSTETRAFGGRNMCDQIRELTSEMWYFTHCEFMTNPQYIHAVGTSTVTYKSFSLVLIYKSQQLAIKKHTTENSFSHNFISACSLEILLLSQYDTNC